MMLKSFYRWGYPKIILLPGVRVPFKTYAEPLVCFDNFIQRENWKRKIN